MTKALVKRDGGGGSKLRGVVPAVASGFVPGLGQLINRQSDKAIGVFAVSLAAGALAWTSLPIIATVGGVVGAGTWIYGVADGYFTARKKRR